MFLSSLPSSLQDAFLASPKAEWLQKLFQHRSIPPTDIFEELLFLRLDESNRPDTQRHLLPQPREVTLSALAMTASHLTSSTQPSGGHAFQLLTRLHLYFAKMDPLLVNTIAELPNLTHLRLTRSFSENLAEAVYRLLGGDQGYSKMKCIIVEAGIYMEFWSL